MSEQQISGLEAYVRGNVTQNSRGFTKEHTVSVKAQVVIGTTEMGDLRIRVKTDDGRALPMFMVLDALHQEADQANQREIERQREQQLAAIRSGN